jgi:uncharacterized protein involved in copper resistance
MQHRAMQHRAMQHRAMQHRAMQHGLIQHRAMQLPELRFACSGLHLHPLTSIDNALLKGARSS